MEDYRNSSLGRRFDEAADFVRAYSTELPVLRKLLPSIQTPVFILAGLHDLVVPPANGQLLKDHLPRSRYELLEGGHLIWEDASEQYAASIYDWVSDGYRTVLN
jgi:pimeloyl-ACP methyl ester carboxylesterase